MVYEPIDPTDPNTRYEYKSLGIWNNINDVNTFFTQYTYAKNWTGLSVGNCININDGTYNKQWIIAGFNTETATDGTPGGIVFIPCYTNVLYYYWDDSTGSSAVMPYSISDINFYINGTMKNNLYTILGPHIVQRNVTLGCECSGYQPRNWTTSATTNTTAYLTLMSYGQLSGTFGSHNNSMDDGEANYKLPLFNFISLSTYSNSQSFWLRNVYGRGSSGYLHAWYITRGDLWNSVIDEEYGVRPLMYLR